MAAALSSAQSITAQSITAQSITARQSRRATITPRVNQFRDGKMPWSAMM